MNLLAISYGKIRFMSERLNFDTSVHPDNFDGEDLISKDVIVPDFFESESIAEAVVEESPQELDEGFDALETGDTEKGSGFIKKIFQKGSSALKTLRGRFSAIKEVERQDKLGRKLLLSEDFIQGKTMIHQTQLKYLDDSIDIAEDEAYRQVLIERKNKTQDSFVALEKYAKLNLERQNKVTGGWAETKTLGRIFHLVYGGSVPGGAAAILMKVLGASLATSAAAAPYLIGGGIAAKLTYDELRKIFLQKKLLSTLRKFTDLHEVVENKELQAGVLEQGRQQARLELLSNEIRLRAEEEKMTREAQLEAARVVVSQRTEEVRIWTEQQHTEAMAIEDSEKSCNALLAVLEESRRKYDEITFESVLAEIRAKALD